ncbi:superoxide dismutase [Heterostelium album PN500]|uniref:Superoxide dismutase n=1 Tax=Heterostelium pallidum (strain ATCC 26659 / Pp 5 / PN500) TaxID=670386 RepID=D3BQ36_HETP5|nr:superoxide dismutase [Heterostelium album PN500]EFA76587.1 superoxide dismutase [Heterostelium album PN500]|eukprot:XP_020428719.1 superoxide dismutase [Heterostelium album PN500]
MLSRFTTVRGVTQLCLSSGLSASMFVRNYYKLPEIQYRKKGLAPFISDKALNAHIQLHQEDIDKANNLIDSTPYNDLPISQALKSTATDSEDAAFFKSTSSHYNHSFFWRSITDDVTKPSALMLKAIRMDFGSIEDFKIKFSQNASSLNTGFTWLVFRDKSLEIINTFENGSPLELENAYPLLCLDVHEHAYFLDYQNNKYTTYQKYIANFWNFVNWDFVEEKFMNALVNDREYKMRLEEGSEQNKN